MAEKGSMNLQLIALDEKGQKFLMTPADVRAYLCPNATDKEIYLALGICKSFNLNPFKREVHIIKYDKDSKAAQIVVGYEVYTKRAERTGKLDGWDVDTGYKKILDEAGKEKMVPIAFINIYRKDWSRPFHWEVRLTEFNKKQSTWNQIPDFMGKKVAIAQGFRLAFPDELGGMPYTKEEYEVYDIQAEPTEKQSTKPVVAEPQTLTDKAKAVKAEAVSPETAGHVTEGAKKDENKQQGNEQGNAIDLSNLGDESETLYSIAAVVGTGPEASGEVVSAMCVITDIKPEKDKKKNDITIYFVKDIDGPECTELYTNGKPSDKLAKGVVVKFMGTAITELNGKKVLVGYDDFITIPK